MSAYLSEITKIRAPATPRKSRFWLHVVLLTIGGGYLRAWSMMNESPSFEEVLAALMALVPFGEYLRHAHPDFCPPVFYLFTHPVATLTNSLGALRVVSIAAGALTPVALYIMGRRLYGELAALIAAYLLLLNPLHIYYSQELQPSALFALLSIGAFLAMVRSAESNRWRDWLVYDILAILLLHTQREAAFFVLAFPVIQMCRALFFPPVNQERRIHRFRLVQGILLNHFIIIAISIPWLWIMPNKVLWVLPVPELSDITRVFGQYFLFGFTGWRPLASWLVALIVFLLLLPPLLKMVRQLDFRTFAALALTFLTLLLPFIYSQFETPRFLPEREGFTAVPWFCLSLGILLARCNWLIKSTLVSLFAVTFILASISQARTLQKTATTDMLNTIIRDGADEDSTIAFWPTYTTALGEFWNHFYGRSFNTVSASYLLQSLADVPQDKPTYFVVSQFPSDSAHLYTFQGALTQYAHTEVLWQYRLNMVMKSTDLNQNALSQWFSRPKSLRILDQPTSNTQFIYTAADPVFRPKRLKDTDTETTETLRSAAEKDWPFAYDRVDLSYDATGHRYIWTTKASASLNLNVTLAPGKYLLRLHCSPDFEQPEYGRYKERSVMLTLRTGEDQRRVKLDHAQTVVVPFSTDVELQTLPVTIAVDDVLKVPPPSPGTYGVKIYSLSIDQELPRN